LSHCTEGRPPTILGIDHIGIAVESLERASRFYTEGLGLSVASTEELLERGLRVAFILVGGVAVELLEPTEHDSAVARFLARRGPGIHHVALRVDDIEAELRRLAEQGYELIDRSPRAGAGGKRVAFVSPKGTGGVLFELCQVPHSR
jgi:methylmalonyl-CoA epimerase